MSSRSVRDRIRLSAKRLLFPGLDLHTRCRYRFLSRYFRVGDIDTLDAGCGNGALSYAAYRREGRVCTDESVGWHVRDGYTLESYQALLEPLGFQIVTSAEFGSPLLVKLVDLIQPVLSEKGAAFALPLFLLTWPLQFFDYPNPAVPFSLYVQCVKNPQAQEQ